MKRLFAKSHISQLFCRSIKIFMLPGNKSVFISIWPQMVCQVFQGIELNSVNVVKGHSKVWTASWTLEKENKNRMIIISHDQKELLKKGCQTQSHSGPKMKANFSLWGKHAQHFWTQNILWSPGIKTQTKKNQIWTFVHWSRWVYLDESRRGWNAHLVRS